MIINLIIKSSRQRGNLTPKPLTVNERRAEVGLGTIEDYISNWGMVWDLEKHKERAKKIESKKKE